jgi:hypothetical protein
MAPAHDLGPDSLLGVFYYYLAPDLAICGRAGEAGRQMTKRERQIKKKIKRQWLFNVWPPDRRKWAKQHVVMGFETHPPHKSNPRRVPTAYTRGTMAANRRRRIAELGYY